MAGRAARTEQGTRHRPVRIAIDGPAGSGKSTLARLLAEHLDLPYVNTGLMYRALARRAIDHGVDPSNAPALERMAGGFRFTLGKGEVGGPPELAIDGEPAGADLRADDVEQIVSTTSAHPGVRSVLRDEQRRLAEGGAVMEGRDIGSVVLPDADVKIYLDAQADVRVERRELEVDLHHQRVRDVLDRACYGASAGWMRAPRARLLGAEPPRCRSAAGL